MTERGTARPLASGLTGRHTCVASWSLEASGAWRSNVIQIDYLRLGPFVVLVEATAKNLRSRRSRFPCLHERRQRPRPIFSPPLALAPPRALDAGGNASGNGGRARERTEIPSATLESVREPPRQRGVAAGKALWDGTPRGLGGLRRGDEILVGQLVRRDQRQRRLGVLRW